MIETVISAERKRNVIETVAWPPAEFIVTCIDLRFKD